VWINNAGVGAIGPFWEIPLEEHSRLIDVNLKGVIYGSYEAIRLFRTQRYSTLINTGSIESEVPLAYHASYAASKAAVRSPGETLYQELHLSYHSHRIMPHFTESVSTNIVHKYQVKDAPPVAILSLPSLSLCRPDRD